MGSSLAAHLTDADAVVFAAGAGPGSGTARKDTVDRAAAALLADAARTAGVRRYLLVSSMGVDGDPPPDTDEVFVAYLRAKKAAEDDLTRRDLDWTVLRPGRLTDDPPTGHVTLDRYAPRGPISRADVAAVLAALLDTPATAGLTLETVAGPTPITAAVTAHTGR
ncbi:NAD(P)-binding oxidoreductase [Micromonospora sp. NPDC049900]|uniref:NAD(P)-binding oxidoreductase n=1 Tax=Micromonospora sp. NPDC049900 TaxID=3364275 RepID=UPI003795E131